jgi:hypothetical protein
LAVDPAPVPFFRVAAFAEEASAQGERDVFATAWEFLSQHRDYIVYHYSKQERIKCRKLQ